MFFLKAIGIAVVILIILVLAAIALVKLVAGLCDELEHEKDDETLQEIEKWREGK